MALSALKSSEGTSVAVCKHKLVTLLKRPHRASNPYCETSQWSSVASEELNFIICADTVGVKGEKPENYKFEWPCGECKLQQRGLSP